MKILRIIAVFQKFWIILEISVPVEFTSYACFISWQKLELRNT